MKITLIIVCFLIAVLPVIARERVTLYRYDQNGNLQELYQDGECIESYQYNALNQLSLLSQNSALPAAYAYHYYPNGQRSNKENLLERSKINFYYGQRGKLINESLISNGSEIKKATYFMGNRFIKNVYNINNSTLQVALAVRENNPISIDLSQGLSDKVSVQLDGYGLQSDQNGAQSQLNNKEALIESSFNNNPFIYGAGYYDSESGLNFQTARYYDPSDARFISQDNRNLVNRYSYANANPVMNYDPSGHSAIRTIAAYTIGTSDLQMGLTAAGILTTPFFSIAYYQAFSYVLMVGVLAGGAISMVHIEKDKTMDTTQAFATAGIMALSLASMYALHYRYKNGFTDPLIEEESGVYHAVRDTESEVRVSENTLPTYQEAERGAEGVESPPPYIESGSSNVVAPPAYNESSVAFEREIEDGIITQSARIESESGRKWFRIGYATNTAKGRSILKWKTRMLKFRLYFLSASIDTEVRSAIPKLNYDALKKVGEFYELDELVALDGTQAHPGRVTLDDEVNRFPLRTPE